MTRSRAAASVILPAPPERYDQQDQAELRRTLEQAMRQFAISQPKETVTGAKGGNAALTSLLTALANLGLITDSTT